MSWLPKLLENNSHVNLNAPINRMTTSALTSQIMQTPESYKPLMNLMQSKDLKTAQGPVQQSPTSEETNIKTIINDRNLDRPSSPQIKGIGAKSQDQISSYTTPQPHPFTFSSPPLTGVNPLKGLGPKPFKPSVSVINEELQNL